MNFLDITTNVGCGIKCLFCPQRDFIKEYSKRSDILKMGFEPFKTCIDKVPSYVSLVFGGYSEPWLNHECTKMVIYAYKNGHPSIYVHTTLVGMTTADICLLEGIRFLAFKVHVPCDSGYDNIKMDENYMETLKMLRKSKINASYRYHGRRPRPEIGSVIGNVAVRVITIPRSVCVPKIVDINMPKKKRGAIICNYNRDLTFNELLPNGDVVLCCEDFGLRHTLGNLLVQNYNSLFGSKEYLRAKSGLKDSASEIICRYCWVSRNERIGVDFCYNFLNADIRFLLFKIIWLLKNDPLAKKWPVKKLLRLLGLYKVDIDL